MSAIHGVNVAAVTPRKQNSTEVDLGAALAVIDYLSASGVNGIALMGSTGELVHFDLPERIRLMALAVKRSRVPIIASIAHSTLAGALRLAHEAESAGAAALLLMPPYFFRYSHEAVTAFYLQFAEQIRRAMPIYLYNIPFFTNEIACETAIQLLETGLFAGIKDSSGEMEYFERLKALRERAPFTLLAGNDTIFARARSEGADGGISGVACAVPELMLAMDRAIAGGDTVKRDSLDARLQEFIAWLNRFPAPIGVKVATGLRGLEIGPLASPLGAEAECQLDEFREWFRGWLPLVQQESNA